MKILAVLLFALCSSAGAADFKLVGENKDFAFHIDISSVKISAVGTSREIAATIRLAFNVAKFETHVNAFVAQEDYNLTAKCGEHKVLVKSLTSYDTNKKVISVETLNSLLEVSKDYTDEDLNVANKFYNVSCEVKKFSKKPML